MARASRHHHLQHSTARTLAALLGTLPVALAFGVVVARMVPLDVPQRTLLGYFSVFPVWVLLCLRISLAPSGKRAWLSLLAASALLGAVASLGSCGATHVSSSAP